MLSANALILLCFFLWQIDEFAILGLFGVIACQASPPPPDIHSVTLVIDSPISNRKDDRMSLALQLRDFRLTTAEILYRLPDHPCVLQTYIWQEMDLAPQYPTLRRFLDFWTRELEGGLHSVRVCHAGSLIAPARFRHIDVDLTLH